MPASRFSGCINSSCHEQNICQACSLESVSKVLSRGWTQRHSLLSTCQNPEGNPVSLRKHIDLFIIEFLLVCTNSINGFIMTGSYMYVICFDYISHPIPISCPPTPTKLILSLSYFVFLLLSCGASLHPIRKYLVTSLTDLV